MADNTTLNANSTTGDSVRAIDRQYDADLSSSAGPKTQVVALDLGGPGGQAEFIPSGFMPTRDPYAQAQFSLQMQALWAQRQNVIGTSGFVPLELPLFLAGF